MSRRVVAAVMATLAVLTGCGAGGPRGGQPTPDQAAAGVFTDLAPDVFEPCGMTSSPDALWVLACSGKVVRVPMGGGPRSTRKVDGDIVALNALAGNGADSVWALLASGSGTARGGRVVRLATGDGSPVATIDLGKSLPMSAVFAGGTLWVASIDGRLFALRASSARALEGGPPLIWIAAEGDRTFTIAETGAVTERRSTTGLRSRSWPTAFSDPIGAGAGLGSVWLSSRSRGVARLDPSTGTVVRVDVPGAVNFIERCGRAMWLSQPDFGVRAVDDHAAVVRSIELAVAPRYLACAGSKLWVLSEDGRLGWIDAAV